MHNDSPNDLIAAAQSVLGIEETPAIQEQPAFVEEAPTEAPAFVETVPVEQQVVDVEPVASLAVQPTHSSEIVEHHQTPSGMVTKIDEDSGPPAVVATQFQKFGELPSHIRDYEGVNLYDVKKLNLASVIEALDRATVAYENFPSPDGAFAVASLSEQVLKLTRDLEKTIDPQKILDDIIEGPMESLTKEIVQDLSGEMKRVLQQCMVMVKDDKKEAFELAFKEAVLRMGPAMKERLEISKNRMARVLKIKPPKKESPNGT